jgi:hypothetical protein
MGFDLPVDLSKIVIGKVYQAHYSGGIDQEHNKDIYFEDFMYRTWLRLDGNKPDFLDIDLLNYTPRQHLVVRLTCNYTNETFRIYRHLFPCSYIVFKRKL